MEFGDKQIDEDSSVAEFIINELETTLESQQANLAHDIYMTINNFKIHNLNSKKLFNFF